MDSLIRTCVWAVLITGILGLPVARTHIQEGPNLYVATGSTINLTCILAENNVSQEVSWSRNGTAVDADDSPRVSVEATAESGSASRLRIQSAGSTDTGKYTCRPEQGDAADIWVYVLDGSISAELETTNSTSGSISSELQLSNSTSEFVCAYKDSFYSVGAYIYPDDDPCIVCVCNDENWKGVDNSSCYRSECSMEKNERHLDAGCVPVYQEKECCPTEYYCPETGEDSSGNIFVTPNEESSENNGKCYFAGKAYDVGIDIPVNNSCIKCRCDIPPGPTCVRQSCPPNSGNCPLTYKDNECCPIYNCVLEDEDIDSTTENIYANCPTPMCADKSCVIGVPPGQQCPTCICDDTSSENDLDVSHEKNDLEPSFEELDPRFVERYNGTQTLDNEIQSQVLSKNYSERESLSPAYEEHIPQTDKFEREEMRSPKYAPKISMLNEDESTFNETEFELGLTTTQLDIHEEDADSSISNTHELRQKRSGNLETAGIQTQNSQQQWNVLQQDQFIEDVEDSGENSERELEGNDEDFAEMTILSTKNSKSAQKSLDELVELDDNELENVVWISEVSGCPAPMCADSSCRIGIPQGHTCPTCVCKKKRRQP